MGKLVQILKQLHVVREQKVTLSHAGDSHYYLDIKKAYGNPFALRAISQSLGNCLPKGITCIAASGYGGLPPAALICEKYNFNLTLVRDAPKKHGMGGWIDGYVPTAQDVVAIVDDVFTTGSSLKKTLDVLLPTKARVIGCYVVVKRGNGDLNVPLSYLMTSQELV